MKKSGNWIKELLGLDIHTRDKSDFEQSPGSSLVHQTIVGD